MEEALDLARAKDAKERMAGVERLHQFLEASRKSLSPAEVASLVDCCMDLLKEGNFRVSQGALQALSSAAVLSGEHFKLHLNALVPAIVERLGDGKQPVRDAARQLLITVMEVSSPTIIVERAGSYAWTHKTWRVREEFARTVTSAVGLFGSTELPLQRVLLPPILQLFNDSNFSVREAATLCIEEMYTQFGPQIHDELQHQNLPLSMMKEISARLEKLEPKAHHSDGHGSNFIPTEAKSLHAGHKRSSPRNKSITRESSLFGGESDITEKPIDPIKFYTEKELAREIEKIASTLVPEKDWSIRIAAMQRIEGLVFGGAMDYPSFPMLLRQLVTPLSTQLSDRRSSIVKQACHVLSFLSKELLGDFEACAEMFIPVLFKLVVVTILVIAESADNCIKTMLRNCKVARVLPKLADCAKNDRSSVLRVRCCEYAILVLEYWADASEIQRSADLYEDLIKCCVADAMSEVRLTARTCYRMFTKTWPERSRRLFLSFDPAIQRIINEEEGGIQKRYASPSLRERGVQLLHAPSHTSTTNTPGYGTSAIVAVDKSASITSGKSLSLGSLLPSQTKPSGKVSERSVESVLHSSIRKVSAIESLLRGASISEKQNSSISHSSSLDLGADPPSARDPPFPAAIPDTEHLSLQNSVSPDAATVDIAKSGVSNGASNLTSIVTSQSQASRDAVKLSYINNQLSGSLSALSLPYTSKRVSGRFQEGEEDKADIRSTRQLANMQVGKQHFDTLYKDAGYRDSQNNYVPNFQRPLLRKLVTGRVTASSRNSFDDSQLTLSEMACYLDGPASLNDALNEGLSPSSDWIARVSAFNYIQTLLQQGPKGIQEVTLSFEKTMKLFSQHLDDPHHKVAQAAFSTLTEIIPPCRKPFESYLERIIPHVFSRLIDPKELVRQSSSTTLEIVGRTYGIESLLPALLRSLDEQRSPKAKLAVIEFTNSSFSKHPVYSEGYSNNGFLKLWLSKLHPLVNDKKIKLKEAAISGIISVYSHYDSTSVLNFILSLSVEEQNSLRRALKQCTPRIEVDLVNFLQSRKERQRSKSFYEQSDVVLTSSEEGYGGTSKKGHFFGRYAAGSGDNEGLSKLSSMQESLKSVGQVTSGETQQHLFHNTEPVSDSDGLGHKSKDLKYNNDVVVKSTRSRAKCLENSDSGMDLEIRVANPLLDITRLMSSDGRKADGLNLGNESTCEMEVANENMASLKNNSNPKNGPSIPQLLHQICIRNDEDSSLNKREALHQLVEASKVKEHSIWAKYFNQILTVVLEVLDDPDSPVRELALSLIMEMLNHQKEGMEDTIEIVAEKLLHATRDVAAEALNYFSFGCYSCFCIMHFLFHSCFFSLQVSNVAHQCLTIVLAQYDPFRCLDVLMPLLVSDDEKILVVCISCLTKLVNRLSQEELMTQLRSFLPALFEAFGNRSPDVRKTVVLCLVDIYIMLGKAFLPYLEGLKSTQLRLVTIYANRISQARSGAEINAKHGQSFFPI
ncbi:CLIP-associated protein isoform X1 [Phoenix dactylifera]|uniref:CLIP-associated protein isoform X1 n=1 Tax=Phoenix dactylifera TaxID=42345 RepID=A0A8B8ZAZ7_PHODC|nr:CLIP-associated protein isoform X1 [Phoenix dactylifera]